MQVLLGEIMYIREVNTTGAGVVPAWENPKLTAFFQQKRWFFISKRLFDVIVSVLLLPLVALVAIVLKIVNPRHNAGPLIYRQTRMGRNCAPFQALKFRSMRPAEEIARGADDPLELDRITPLGHFMRKSRIDELPQIINVLRGDMSLIGPRPDFYDHAAQFVSSVPGYRERHIVRPGISGLAQTEIGYIEGIAATKKKVAADHYYIMHSSLALDTWVFWRTLVVVLRRAGA